MDIITEIEQKRGRRILLRRNEIPKREYRNTREKKPELIFVGNWFDLADLEEGLRLHFISPYDLKIAEHPGRSASRASEYYT